MARTIQHIMVIYTMKEEVVTLPFADYDQMVRVHQDLMDAGSEAIGMDANLFASLKSDVDLMPTLVRVDQVALVVYETFSKFMQQADEPVRQHMNELNDRLLQEPDEPPESQPPSFAEKVQGLGKAISQNLGTPLPGKASTSEWLSATMHPDVEDAAKAWDEQIERKELEDGANRPDDMDESPF